MSTSAIFLSSLTMSVHNRGFDDRIPGWLQSVVRIVNRRKSPYNRSQSYSIHMTDTDNPTKSGNDICIETETMIALKNIDKPIEIKLESVTWRDVALCLDTVFFWTFVSASTLITVVIMIMLNDSYWNMSEDMTMAQH